ncbi:muconate and chloromuconate cycloisomerase [compost metagenome]
MAEGMGIDVYIGNQIDTQVGTAASVTFGAAFAHTAKRAAELSNYLDMADDLLAEPLAITGGRIRVPEGPGAGTAVDEDKLALYRTDR